MTRFFAALLLVAKNAVPALGILVREWAAPGALLLYLGENIVLIVLAATAMRLLAPAGIEEKIRTFFLISVPFTFAAALFTFAVILIRGEYQIRPRELLAGLAAMLVFQLLSFAADLRRLRGISLPDAENLLVGVISRVFLLAFAVWAGMLLAFAVSSAFVIPFILLKTIVDLANLRSAGLELKQRLRV